MADLRASWDHGLDNALSEAACTCGNPQMGLDCVCDHVERHPGSTNYTCEYCGIYTASQARCNKCEAEHPDVTSVFLEEDRDDWDWLGYYDDNYVPEPCPCCGYIACVCGDPDLDDYEFYRRSNTDLAVQHAVNMFENVEADKSRCIDCFKPREECCCGYVLGLAHSS